MRFRLTFSLVDSDRNIIPVNYQYPLSAWIYKTIAEGNHEFASFLHNSGFISGNKNYKLFTFSQLSFPRKGFKVTDDRLSILSDSFTLILSFMAPEAVEHFIAGLFSMQKFTLGDRISQAPIVVTSVEAIEESKLLSESTFTCISPVVVGKTGEGNRTAEYLSPEHDDFERILIENLIHKYSASINANLLYPTPEALTDEPDISFKLLNTPRKRGITIKDGSPAKTKIIGYTFDFTIKAPIDLIKTGYMCGFGEKNALGMGCVDVLSERKLK